MSKASALPEQETIDPVLATSCFDFLLIELVPLAQRMAERAHARDVAIREARKRNPLFDRPTDNRSSMVSSKSLAVGADDETAKAEDISSVVASAPGTNADTTTLAGIAEDEVRDALFWRLDHMGYRVGQGLVER